MAQLIRDDIDFAQYMRETDAKQKVQPARVWVQEIADQLGKPRAAPKSLLPWQKAHDLISFRPGEVTLWAGVNGHGKSLITGQAMLSLMAQNERICIASFEMKPMTTLKRMTRQFSGMRDAGEWMDNPEVIANFREVYDQFAIFTDGRLWLYDQQGSVKRDAVLGMIRYCANELRIQHVVIDSLMKCVSGEDDYNAQKDFVDSLCSVARDFGIHVHLVHHIRKMSADTETPDKTDVKGSGSITDQVDNLMLVWRNKKKELDRNLKKSITPDDPDALLICDKQRNGEWEGRIALWYEPDSQQFVGSNGAPALDFATWPHNG